MSPLRSMFISAYPFDVRGRRGDDERVAYVQKRTAFVVGPLRPPSNAIWY